MSAGDRSSLTSQERQQVEAIYAAWDAAFNARDAKGIAALYVEDAVFLPATHEVVRGPAGIEQFFEGIFADGLTGHRFELLMTHVDSGSLVAAARWFVQFDDKNNTSAASDGIATHLFLKQADGSLRLKLHTFN